MKYEIYLDSIFTIQFVTDYCVLMLTASLMKLKATRLRIIIAALAGAVGGCLILLPIGISGNLKYLLLFPLFAVLMTGIAFRVRGMQQYLSMMLCLLASSFILGGIAKWITGLKWIPDITEIRIVALISIYILLQAGIYLYRRQKNGAESIFVPVTLTMSGEENGQNTVSVIALRDTGNRLRENSTGKAVCILENSVMPIGEDHDYTVTYHTLGNDNDELKAQMIPKMIIHTKEGDVVSKDVMLAFYPGKISKRGAYHMILHPEYLKEDSK